VIAVPIGGIMASLSGAADSPYEQPARTLLLMGDVPAGRAL